MVFDLRGALLKKEEMETSRLLDFAFRHRVRTMKLLAEALDQPADTFIALVAHHDDTNALAEVSSLTGKPLSQIMPRWQECASLARLQLIEERGDPAPHQLA